MTTLVYVKDKLEQFEDRICSASCHYTVDLEDDYQKIKLYDSKWAIIRCDTEWQPKETEEVEWQSCESIVEVTHWTILPARGDSCWVDYKKFPPNEFLPHLVYLKDKGEDKHDFIVDGSYYRKATKDLDESKIRFVPAYWSIMPSLPRLIDDTFDC